MSKFVFFLQGCSMRVLKPNVHRDFFLYMPSVNNTFYFSRTISIKVLAKLFTNMICATNIVHGKSVHHRRDRHYQALLVHPEY